MTLFRDMMRAGIGVIHGAAGECIGYERTNVRQNGLTAVPRTIRPELRALYDATTLAKVKLWEILKDEFQARMAEEPEIGDVITETVESEEGGVTRSYWEVVNDPVTGHCYTPVGGGTHAFRIFTFRKAVAQ